MKVIKNHVVILGFVLQITLFILFSNSILSEIPYYTAKNIIILVLISSCISAIYSVLRARHIGVSAIVLIATPLLTALFVADYFISLM